MRSSIDVPLGITTPARLAAELAELASRLRTLVGEEIAATPDGPLIELARSLALDHAEFADTYAEAVTYGLFAARWFARERPGAEFVRANVRTLLPVTSASLRELFDRLLDSDFRPRHVALLDELVATLAAAPITELFAGRCDPAIFFYEQFLAHYAPRRRREFGVFYTPEPLVEYVVASVDAGLRERFGLRLGIADPDVELLDPAAGTGAFLLRCVELVHATMRAEYAAAGLDDAAALRAWQIYVRERLLPRLRGCELLLAPWLVGQLRIGLALAQTGFELATNDELRISLTDALASTLSCEARIAVVLGNPPYQRGPGRRSEHVERLVAPFKRGLVDERNLQPLTDDYIAFLGLADDYVRRAGSGVLALVVNGTCLSGRLHRGLRARLLDGCERLALTDLHGSQTVARHEGLDPAAVDENVFDIRQGVAVIHAERQLGSPTGAATILHRDLLGTREQKLAWLRARATRGPFDEHAAIQPSAPLWLFSSASPAPDEYEQFAALTELFEFFSVSGKPGKDELLVAFTAAELIPGLEARRAELERGAVEHPTEAERKLAQRPRERPFEPERVQPYAYRPGDTRFAYYDPEIWTRPVAALVERLDGAPVLLTSRIVKDPGFAHVWVTRGLADVICLSATSSVNCYSFPLAANLRTDHFSATVGAGIEAQAAFDYLYAILHSPEYRRRYAAGLRHDFARIPLPRDRGSFEVLAAIGEQLRELHLFECRFELDPAIARFVDGGDRRIARVGEPRRTLAGGPTPEYGLLHINASSRFEQVPARAWEFRVGGYQLLHKWLSDRKKAGRELLDADIEHVRRLVELCLRTLELMDAVDREVEALGGWPGAFYLPSTRRTSASDRP